MHHQFLKGEGRVGRVYVWPKHWTEREASSKTRSQGGGVAALVAVPQRGGGRDSDENDFLDRSFQKKSSRVGAKA